MSCPAKSLAGVIDGSMLRGTSQPILFLAIIIFVPAGFEIGQYFLRSVLIGGGSLNEVTRAVIQGTVTLSHMLMFCFPYMTGTIWWKCCFKLYRITRHPILFIRTPFVLVRS